MGDAANGAVRLVYDDRVLAILGTVHSANTHVLARVALKCEIPVLTSVSTDPTIVQHSIPWMFRCLVDDQPQGRALARYLFEEKRYTKVCTMWFNNKYGRMGIQELRNIARRLGHPVLYDLQFNPGDTDFTPQLEKVRSSGAEALVLWGLYREIAGIVKQARAMGLDLEICGGDGFVSQAFLDLAGPAAEGLVATFPYEVDAEDPVNRAFIEAFSTAYGHAPDSFGAHGFDAMNVLLDAVERGGLNRALVRDALESTDHHGVTGHVAFDNVGNDRRSPPLARVVEGRFRVLRPVGAR
jgi:branched-chain amino acid transport system substrate-binding protein